MIKLEVSKLQPIWMLYSWNIFRISAWIILFDKKLIILYLGYVWL
jgi:hypothetical protein